MEIPSWLLPIAPSLVGALIAAIVAPLMTVTLNLRNYYRQRWWERKAEAYSLIIESLVSMRFYFWENGMAELGERAVSEDRQAELGAEYRRGLKAIERTAAAGSFVVSQDTSRALSDLVKKLEDQETQERSSARGYFDMLEAGFVDVEACIASIREYAGVDLKLAGHRRHWWRWGSKTDTSSN